MVLNCRMYKEEIDIENYKKENNKCLRKIEESNKKLKKAFQNLKDYVIN